MSGLAGYPLVNQGLYGTALSILGILGGAQTKKHSSGSFTKRWLSIQEIGVVALVIAGFGVFYFIGVFGFVSMVLFLIAAGLALFDQPSTAAAPSPFGGAKDTRACPHCGHENPPVGRTCQKCGCILRTHRL